MITLETMVEGNSIEPEGADLLMSIGEARESFLVYSLPRNAGKSTLVEAILAKVPAGCRRYDFTGTESETTRLLSQSPDGYLVVAEMGHRGRPGYLAGEEVARVFQLVNHGYPLASSLHADTVGQVYEVLSRNGVSVEEASTIRYLVKVQALGDPFDPGTRRIVEAIHEVSGVVGGEVHAIPRYRAGAA